MADPQIEFWTTMGLLALIGAAFAVGFYLWPTGGDPNNGGQHGGGY